MQAQKYFELKISGEAINETSFSVLTSSQNAAGFAVEKDADSGATTYIAWFKQEEKQDEQCFRLTAATLLLDVPSDAIKLRTLDENWATAWQQQWQALAIGETLWVRPPFCAPPADDRIDIILDPGMAFGTGTHATTQLCLTAIEHVCKEASMKSMLDMGTGSGILAITAAKLGLTDISAIDNDADAIKACLNNAKVNGVSINACLGDTPPKQSFDLVVANILACPLIDMAASLSNAVSGVLVLSGLLQTQAKSVVTAYQQQGLTLIYTKQLDEWVALTFVRPT
ncbi:MAG: 50S ribosomal protein L11 methyltransferase [Mariprofundaceae bacterium]